MTMEKHAIKAVKIGYHDGGIAPASGQVVPLSPSGQTMISHSKLFKFSDLKRATKNFKQDRIIGEGAFGKVYKGWMECVTFGYGLAVAIKKSDPLSDQGFNEWQTEVKLLEKLIHPNIVKLYGYCWEKKKFLLVYEYMQKGSLDMHLFSEDAEPLPWDTRIKIALGVARGLAFLHTTENNVICRDVKCSNILLDEDYNAKLSDFGMAKLGPVDGESHVSTCVKGTYGYAAPEYVATGSLSYLLVQSYMISSCKRNMS
ncbi:putative serine/threonine-protein kinase CST [Bidens hawaiensis]|uniref:putative serine/threonine-protein kinase CST n=1 Tax=Bidens hawaiensis TaxID=980011 RepID=UPI004049AA2C